ncbi:MAG: CHAT domain-containing protein [Caldilinea sp. CFX5]|nr:CHAT domain-containing protein [Caldilinea sp. CFX5]
MSDDYQHCENLRSTFQRRLQILELQNANFGISTPPHILMEMDDIRRQISSIEIRLTQLTEVAKQYPPQDEIVILFLAADPTNASRLRLGAEFSEIDEQLKLAKYQNKFKLELPEFSLRSKNISRALLNLRPQIVHFSGHGTAEGALCFEDEIGQSHLVRPDMLASLFEQFADQVNCVVLNACYSWGQANAIAAHIEYVVGMNQAIGDQAAIAFSIGFYQALGAGCTIEEAYKLGCVQIKMQDISESLTPVLVKKATIQP